MLDTLEREISALHWDKKWNKTLKAFLLLAHHKLQDHQGLTDCTVFPDTWYIKKLNPMFSGHNEITSYLRQLRVQEANYIRLSGHAVSTVLTYELHYTQLQDFCMTLDGHNKEAAEMKHSRSIMKVEVKRSMNIADSNANNSHSTDQSGCGCRRDRSHGHGCGQGQGHG